MKRLIILIALMLLSACTQAQVNLVPPGTLAAQTLAAMPRTDTPAPPTLTPAPTETPVFGPPTPVLDLSIPGAYCLPVNGVRTSALVTKIIDGETIEVATGVQTMQVRYIGLDAPNILPQQPEWQAAQAFGFNSNLTAGKMVILVQDTTNTDMNGVFLRYVIADRTFINYEMVRQGFARFISSAPDIACDNALIAAQVEAQAGVRGVWQPTPTATSTTTPTPTFTVTPGTQTFTPQPPCNCQTVSSCSQFNTQESAQACYNYCRRMFNIEVLSDKNGNGLVCEGSPSVNPGRP